MKVFDKGNEIKPTFVGEFSGGFARVQRESGGWNFIRQDGRTMCAKWWADADDFIEGSARVQRASGAWFIINTNGEVVG